MDPRERIANPHQALHQMLRGHQAKMWTALPATVHSFNATAMTAELQPTIQASVRGPDGTFTWTTLPLLVDVPVVFPSGGGFTLTFPVTAGDEALVVFSTMCIDNWWLAGGVQSQAELRLHDLSDGFAFVGPRSQPRVLSAINTAAAQLRSDDGATYVEVGAGELKLTPDSGTTSLVIVPGKITLTGAEIISHATVKNVWDADGTGFVYQAGQIDTYTNGVPSTSHAPAPPEVPT